MGLSTVLGGVASVVGGVLGNKSASKAASKAADTSLQVAQENNALAKDIYGQNKAMLSPYNQRGNVAGDTINALLGLGGSQPQQTQQTQQTPNALAQFQGGSVNDFGGVRGITPFRSAASGYGIADGQSGMGNPYYSAGGGPVNALSAQQAASNAFDTFRNSTPYQFTFNQGQDAVKSLASAGGWLQSGAALQEAQNVGQNTAFNTAFAPYMGYLSNQQGVGLSGASAVAGVGQNYVNNVSANNNSAGSAAANAYLVKGQNNPFANALSTAGGVILGGY